ncbi:hypothetical protein E2C01_082907 [Portunus trituberculatus]|uniref:Uncharacterized protein n=1 Tax=Portunus trituberculatus TaxID=210409 RepID=A0A5B7J509_PORTR|nr:hypothetical protein [Portunus trituberculatus]
MEAEDERGEDTSYMRPGVGVAMKGDAPTPTAYSSYPDRLPLLSRLPPHAPAAPGPAASGPAAPPVPLPHRAEQPTDTDDRAANVEAQTRSTEAAGAGADGTVVQATAHASSGREAAGRGGRGRGGGDF